MRATSLAVLGTVALLLTGCAPAAPSGAAPASESPTPTATPSPTPTIDPGPVALTKEEAGKRYLGIVCGPNFAGQTLYDATIAQEDAFLNGEGVSLDGVKAAADVNIRAIRTAVELIDDTYVTWPGDIGEHLQHVRAEYLADSSTLSDILNTDRFDDVYYADWNNSAESATASQEIRLQLGIPADAFGSCKGYETAGETLHQEMTERNAYLATFTDPEG